MIRIDVRAYRIALVIAGVLAGMASGAVVSAEAPAAFTRGA